MSDSGMQVGRTAMRKTGPRSHPLARGCLVLVAGTLVLTLGVMLAVTALGGWGSPASGRATAARKTSASPAARGVTVTRHLVSVVFQVWGSAASGAQITYGSDSDSRSPRGSLGPLGEGRALPWKAHLAWSRSALYYDVTAQLQGGGDIDCGVWLKVTDWFSNGTRRSASKRVASGHASGSYNICDAQVNN